MRGAIPHLMIKIPGTREGRVAFEAFSQAILGLNILTKLSADNKLDVCYELAPYGALRPYRRCPTSYRLSLREIVEFPAENVVDDRPVTLTLFQRLDLILCTTIEEGRSFLLSIPDHDCSSLSKPIDVAAH